MQIGESNGIRESFGDQGASAGWIKPAALQSGFSSMQPDGDLSSGPNRQSKSSAGAVRFESDLRGRGDEREVAATGIHFVECDAEAF